MLLEILRRRKLRAVSILVLAFGIGLTVADAQTLGSSDIQSILQGVQAQQQATSPPTQPNAGIPPATQTVAPAQLPALSTAPSGLEQQFSTRPA
ncbi:MAG: hypothetical protein WDM89_20360 [Rhizomicrobium sp.]